MNDGSAPSPGYDNEALVFLFRLASRLMARAYHRHAHAHHAQEHVLELIREQGPIKQSDLLELLDVRSSSLSEVLGKLERHGLIERRRNEQDRRSFVISAVQEAGVSSERPPQGCRESANTLFACLDAAERRQLGGLLEKIIGSLENDQLCRDAQEEACAHGPHHHKHKDRRERELGGRFPGHGGRGVRGKRGGRGGFRPGGKENE